VNPVGTLPLAKMFEAPDGSLSPRNPRYLCIYERFIIYVQAVKLEGLEH
jgi:hypothetical protein